MAVDCVQLDATRINAEGWILGMVLIVGTFLAPLPAFIKLYKRKNLQGFSAATVQLTLLYNASGAAGTLVVKWLFWQRLIGRPEFALAHLLDLGQQLACRARRENVVRTDAVSSSRRGSRRASRKEHS